MPQEVSNSTPHPLRVAGDLLLAELRAEAAGVELSPLDSPQARRADRLEAEVVQ